MLNVPENELFSAYLDGELTAAEQADVERLLAASPAARQLMDELRALSSTLQSLPAHKLDEDLSQQVLRLAEQRVLMGGTDSDPNFQGPAVPAGRWQAIGRRLRQPRIWAWPAAAAAVAIVLAVLHPEQAGRVARRPGEEPVALAPEARRELPAIGARDRGEEFHFRRGLGRESLADADREQPAAAPVEVERLKIAAKEKALPAAPPVVPLVVPPPAASASESGLAATAQSRGAAVEAGSAMSAAAGGESLARPMKAAIAATPSLMKAGKAVAGWADQLAAGDVLVVHCSVAPAAMEQRYVEQLLARQGLTLGPAGLVLDNADPSRTAGDYVEAKAKQKESAQDAKQELAQSKDRVAKQAEVSEGSSRLKVTESKPLATEGLVYIRAEATRAQLDAVLDALRSQPETVCLSSITVAADGAPSQVDHLYYDRFARSPKGGMPGFGGGLGGMGASPADQPSQSADFNVQNQATIAESAEGRRDAAQARRFQQLGAANTANSAAASNTQQSAESQFGMPRSTSQAGGAWQKAAPATQANGTRLMEPSGATRDLEPKLQGAYGSVRQGPARPEAGRGQQAAGLSQGARMPSPPPASAPKSEKLAKQQVQEPVRYHVVFVVRAVDPKTDASQIVNEKAAKIPAEAAKAASAKPSPPPAAATKPAEPAKPAATAPDAPPAAK